MHEKCKVPKSDTARRSAIAAAIRSVRLLCCRRPCLASCVVRLTKSVCLLFCLTSSAALEVEWNGPNQVIISGIGQGGDEPPYTVITNFIGSCTNCSQVTTDELQRFAHTLNTAADDAQLSIVLSTASLISATNEFRFLRSDISSYRRIADPVYGWEETTNYLASADNKQVRAVNSAVPNYNANIVTRRYAGYACNAVYDYANDYVLPAVADAQTYCEQAMGYANTAYQHLDTVKAVSRQLEQIPVCDNNANYPTNSPQAGIAAETLEELLAIVRHIDDDCHNKIKQLDVITNRFANLEQKYEQYSRLVSDALYQPNGTIRIAQGDTWESIYNLGESNLFDYNKSNVLQRIELLLYGLVMTNSSVDVSGVTGDDTDPEDESDRIQESLDSTSISVDGTLGDAESTFREVVRKWQLCLDKFSGLNQNSSGHTFKMFGFAHNNDNDSWLDDVYASADDLDTISKVRSFTRPAFGIFYWLVAASIVWVFYTRVFDYIWRAIGWILEYTNSLFDS